MKWEAFQVNWVITVQYGGPSLRECKQSKKKTRKKELFWMVQTQDSCFKDQFINSQTSRNYEVKTALSFINTVIKQGMKIVQYKSNSWSFLRLKGEQWNDRNQQVYKN